jgi:DNA-binding MarR family transcriptional regulator
MIARLQAPTMSELANTLVLHLTALNHNLKPLVRDGLVSLQTGREDRLSRRLRLTALGSRRLAESLSYWQDAQSRFESGFGAGKASLFRDCLDEICSENFLERFNLPSNGKRSEMSGKTQIAARQTSMTSLAKNSD